VNATTKSNEFAADDLIGRIAKALPVEMRADYYRELRHCRSLPESDEAPDESVIVPTMRA